MKYVKLYTMFNAIVYYEGAQRHSLVQMEKKQTVSSLFKLETLRAKCDTVVKMHIKKQMH